MRIRNGFVSNSSSTSFLLALPSTPVSWMDLMDMIVDEEEFIPANFSNRSHADVSMQIYDSIDWVPEKINEEYISDWASSYLTYMDGKRFKYRELPVHLSKKMNELYRQDKYEEAYEIQREWINKEVLPQVQKWFKENENKKFFLLAFGDGGGHGCYDSEIEWHFVEFCKMPLFIQSNH